MAEIWKDIPSYEGYYQASDLGRIRSLTRIVISNNGQKNKIEGQIIKPSIFRRYGYQKYNLGKDGKQKTFSAHVLMGNTFLKRLDFPSLQLNHKDGIKTNNQLNNLELVTASQNQQHCVNIGLRVGLAGERNPGRKFNESTVREIRRIKKEGQMTQKDIAKLFNMTKGNVSMIVNNKAWKSVV